MWSSPYTPLCFTCILWGADTVAVALFVHRSSGARRGESPVSGQGVWGAGGVWPVQSPLAGIAAPSRGRTSFGSASGSGIWWERVKQTNSWWTEQIKATLTNTLLWLDHFVWTQPPITLNVCHHCTVWKSISGWHQKFMYTGTRLLPAAGV